MSAFVVFPPGQPHFVADDYGLKDVPDGSYMYSRSTDRWYHYKYYGELINQNRVAPDDVPSELRTTVLLLT